MNTRNSPKKDQEHFKMNLMGFDFISTNIDYRDGNSYVGSADIYINKTNDYVVPFVIVISAKEFINPAERTNETYQHLLRVLDSLNITLERIELYLDLFEVLGVRSNFVFRWVFNNSKGIVEDTLTNIDLDNMNTTISNIFERIYTNKISVFAKSALNSYDKVELLAFLLSRESMDFKRINDLTNSFNESLYYFYNKKISPNTKIIDIRKTF